jgi:hypothetical protein
MGKVLPIREIRIQIPPGTKSGSVRVNGGLDDVDRRAWERQSRVVYTVYTVLTCGNVPG